MHDSDFSSEQNKPTSKNDAYIARVVVELATMELLCSVVILC